RFDSGLVGPNEGVPTLWRWTVELGAGKMREEQLDDRPQEFPRVDERVVGRRHRYGWSMGATKTDAGVDFGCPRIIKHDLTQGSSQSHDFGAGAGGSEAVFVPRNQTASEDDGYVITLVYRADTDRSD